jgi:hypothetical protein
MTAEVFPALGDEAAAGRMIIEDRDRGAAMTGPAVEDEALEALVAEDSGRFSRDKPGHNGAGKYFNMTGMRSKSPE